jgi:hypothetical protein
MPRPDHHEPSDEVMDGVASEFGCGGIVVSRVRMVREEQVRRAARVEANRLVAIVSRARHAPARGQLAREGRAKRSRLIRRVDHHAPSREHNGRSAGPR